MNMKNDRPFQIEKVVKERSKRKWWQRVVSILSAVAAFCTTYAMILPAITWERSLVCEIPAHQHDESCYEIKTVPGEKELVCLETEHVHGPECYIVTDNLICNLEESEGHSHSESCYEKKLVCQLPEHLHSDSCWMEGEPHEEKVLVCQLEEHEHTAACFDAPPAEDDGYYCGKIEHTHSVEQNCYYSDGSLRCTIPEHEHSLACKSNPNADVENEAYWCSTFTDVCLTGDWAQDVIAIAKTQIGYAESTRNYEVQEDGTSIKGYTRYGDWYGDAYGDWCAMFCSFCLNYAGVDSGIMPMEASCQRWAEKLSEKEMFRESIYYRGAKDETTEYQPKPGDLIFFDWDNVQDPDHVGLVYEVIKDENDKVIEIKTIEGNNGDIVACHTYEFTDDDIIGYGELPENPGDEEVADTENNDDSGLISVELITEDGVTVTVSGNLPEGAEIRLSEVPEDVLKAILEQVGSDTPVFAYDITIVDAEGNEWQPDEIGAKVCITGLNMPESGIEVVHVPDAGNPEQVEVQKKSEDSIEFVAEGFSIYIGFTVDFYYDDLVFSIQGESSILLSELFRRLEIPKDVADIVSVEFSNPTLVAVEQTQDDWLLTSLLAFTSLENLTITCADGQVFEIMVLDEQGQQQNGSSIQQGVTISKIGKRYNDDSRDYEITLTAAGLNGGEEEQKTTDLILLMDITSSLGPDGYAAMKAAAKELITTMLSPQESTARVALITFTDYAHRAGSGNQVESTYRNSNTVSVSGDPSSAYYYTHDTWQSALNEIDNLPTKTSGINRGEPNTQGSTNIQYGMYLTEQLLALEPADKRPCVILLTDGAPNRAFKLSDKGTVTVTGTSDFTRKEYVGVPYSASYSGTGGDNADYYNTFPYEDIYKYYSAIQPTGLTINYSSEATSYSGLSNGKTITWVSNKGSSKYTLDPRTNSQTQAGIGMMQMTYYESSILKQMTELYVVGVDLDTRQCQNYIKRLATDESHAYNSSASELIATLAKITEKLYAANNARVVDNMGPHVGLKYSGNSPVVTTNLDEYTAGRADIYVSYKEALTYINDPTTNPPTEQIEWSIGNIPFGETFVMRYRVRIDDGVYGHDILLNQDTYIYYDIVTGDSTESKSDKYDDPTGEVERTDCAFSVEKTLTGCNLADERFAFKIQVTDESLAPIDISYAVSESAISYAANNIRLDGSDAANSTILFDLAQSDGAVTFNLPADAIVTLTELSHDGFIVTMDTANGHYSGDSQEYTLNDDLSVTVTNTPGVLLPDTGGIGVYPIYVLGVLIIAGSITGYILRRKRERRAE